MMISTIVIMPSSFPSLLYVVESEKVSPSKVDGARLFMQWLAKAFVLAATKKKAQMQQLDTHMAQLQAKPMMRGMKKKEPTASMPNERAFAIMTPALLVNALVQFVPLA